MKTIWRGIASLFVTSIVFRRVEPVFSNSDALSSGNDGRNNFTNAILDSLEKMVGFYAETYKEMNLDGIFGLRALEGQLSNLLERKFPEGGELIVEGAVMDRVKRLHDTASKIAEEAIPSLQAADPEYAKRFLPLIERPFRDTSPTFHIRRIDSRLIWDQNETNSGPTPDASEAERISDLCISSLIGTRAESGSGKQRRRGGRERSRGERSGIERSRRERSERNKRTAEGTQKKCLIPPQCADYKLKRGTSGYITTHQLLWVHLALVYGCSNSLHNALVSAKTPKKNDINNINNIDNNNSILISEWLKELCTNIAVHVNQSVKVSPSGSPRIEADLEDLFMEQQFVCGFLGFVDVLSLPYLSLTLSWQRENGCYGKERTRQPGRNLLEESDVGDAGCLSHKTAVAAGALAVYLYFSIAAPSSLRTDQILKLHSPRTNEQFGIRSAHHRQRLDLSLARASLKDEALPFLIYVVVIFVIFVLYKMRFAIFRRINVKFL